MKVMTYAWCSVLGPFMRRPWAQELHQSMSSRGSQMLSWAHMIGLTSAGLPLGDALGISIITSCTRNSPDVHFSFLLVRSRVTRDRGCPLGQWNLLCFPSCSMRLSSQGTRTQPHVKTTSVKLQGSRPRQLLDSNFFRGGVLYY